MTPKDRSMKCVDCEQDFVQGGSSLYRQAYDHHWKTGHDNFEFKGEAYKINGTLQ